MRFDMCPTCLYTVVTYASLRDATKANRSFHTFSSQNAIHSMNPTPVESKV